MVLSTFVHCIHSLPHLKLSLSSEIKVHRVPARQKSVSLSLQRVQGVQLGVPHLAIKYVHVVIYQLKPLLFYFIHAIWWCSNSIGSRRIIRCKTVVIATGTFLKGKITIGKSMLQLCIMNISIFMKDVVMTVPTINEMNA